MKKTVIVLMLLTTGLAIGQTGFVPANWTGILTGYWDFENSANLMQAQVGTNLVPQGTFTQVAGPTATNYALRKTLGNYLKCTHGVPTYGQSYSNKYSVMIDFKVPSVGQYYSFMQTNQGNSNDGDLFVNPAGKIGVTALTYSNSAVLPNEWYRLVITADVGNEIKMYIDGQLWNPGQPNSLNGRFSLDPLLLLLADDNGEDNQMDVASIGVFNRPLTAAEVATIGGYGHTPAPVSNGMNPYLQTATPTSLYISWHSTNTSQNPVVKFGTSSSNLNQTTTGTWERISSTASYYWHTVKLTGLQPDTEYFYQCYNGTTASAVNVFRTPALKSTPNQHIRMVVLGDNRTDVAKTTQNVLQIKNKLVELYGPNFHNSVDLILNCGDIVSTGSVVSQYTNEYFTPFAPLTASIPSMISIGNHEGDSSNFFKYMKYEELTNGYPVGHSYNEKFYNYLYGNTQILAVNGNSGYKVSDQINWIDARLQESNANADIDFVFSFLHHPGHSEIWPDGNEVFVQNSILPKLKQYPKNALLAYGHSHNYERGVADIANGSHDMYLELSGGAGSALDRWGMYGNQTDYPEIKVSKDVYSWTLIDIDVDNKSFNAKTFSFGHSNRPVVNELIDEFHLNLNQAKPATPTALGIENQTILTASPMVGVDVAQTCHFQVTATSGNYTTLLINKEQDEYNIYDDTRAPNYTPINKNANLDISKLNASAYGLATGQTYYYRVRYRDENLKWSSWSAEKAFVYNSTLGIKSPTASTEEGNSLKVYPNPVASKADISFELPSAAETVSIELADMSGKTVETIFRGSLGSGIQTIPWHVNSKLSAGLYIMTLTYGVKKETFQVVIDTKL
ncbi:MAG TPA: fibronectin type III domain-containing protein [Flavobacterium sp.]|nr:fibronectin type III domain-containing protein [Flavobacterium sp.]